ncbi:MULTISPECIES: bifunctional lysylphosphatidylglycerol flippase/synthetase MprF [unclassified Enterococcus]|uniref:bifunctional lysylphosphatidylglycerol flippase/synthetase MprF n=1 Tax=unclassified Enterococcus TaxID=2608891 RepID=UPI001CE0648B|nr:MULTISPECIES: bifunctional lysylphosphatidylglycerol flippase/synthetase MprF [unclassified Enterococcus]MCA5012757.1 bifunctional lysylphosphatidylglycerol flippase/synthetase MprF [Enterococcus sp. S23]MCA5016008.1 bifunctional lysylphosphatidylglycerol flippase/synthetase MprF [Enterococcus sp. S22(2020)]
MLQWFKERISYFKIIFIFSVIIIILRELLTISKTISFNQLGIVFQDIPLWKIALMLLIGLVSVLPMLNYDVILNKILGQHPKKRFLIESSWMINTINNIAGFGGLISIGLRSEFYGKEKDGKRVVQALSKILLFLMSGLSIYSLISFLLVTLGHTNDYIQQYWVWLIGGSLYFPIVLLVSFFKKDNYIGDIDRKTRAGLILTSFMEWTGVLGSFLLIGMLMGVKMNPLQIIPLFIAASVIGIVSMIPGELGSFDLLMILGLSALGISREVVVAWILLYRLFYYIIPFLIGVIFFMNNLSYSLNKRYSGIPRELSTEVAHKFVVFLMYFSGIMIVLSATIPEAFIELTWLKRLNPLSFRIITQIPAILLGFLLLITGRGIAARVKRAYFPTIGLIVITLGYTFMKDFSWGVILFLSLLLLIIVFSKRQLFREQLVYSWEMITVDGVIFLTLTILYIVIGVYNLPAFPHHKHKFISFFLFPSEKIWLSGLIGILLVTLVSYLFIRYLEGKRYKIGMPLDDERALSLLLNYGGNTDSQLVFLGDKDMYIYQNSAQEDTVLIQFKTINNKCIVMGDPSGNKEDFSDAIEQFINEADRWGYLPVFYEVSEECVMFLHEFGYDFIKMGEEAHVDLPSFTLSGKKMKSERAVMNRFTKENYSFEVLSPPFSDELVSELKQVSDEWLGSRKEKGFSLGFFNEDYLARSQIAVAKNQSGKIIAFANIMPTYTKEEGTIDLMRYSKEAPSGVMDYLFISLFQHMQEEGLAYFNLGMAPLSNVGTSRKSFIQERIAYLVYEFGSRFYSFQGLRDYKEKYATAWVSRYTLYSRESFIAYVMIALLIIDNAPIEKQKNVHGIRRILRNRSQR